MSDKTETPGQMHNKQARKKALEAFNKQPINPTSLVKYQSKGRIAVIGGMEAMEYAPRLSGLLQPQVILIEGVEEPGVPVIAVGGRTIEIQGYLGAFKITLGDKGKASSETVEVDLILDLNHEPLLDMAMKPPGYFVSSTEEAQLARKVDELSAMTGSFEKPRYFDYDPSLCAHSRAGKTACTRCIESCPAEAISSIEQTIQVNSHLCQGGGVCATVCPSGAIRYSYPQAQDLLNRIRILLRTYIDEGGLEPVLAFVTEPDDGGVQLPSQKNVLPVSVEELASVGLETWLSALAYGARSVLLVNDGSLPEKVAQELHTQVDIAADILSAMSYSSRSIRLVDAAEIFEVQPALMPKMTPASFSASGGKRQAAFFSIDHLYQHAQAYTAHSESHCQGQHCKGFPVRLHHHHLIF